MTDEAREQEQRAIMRRIDDSTAPGRMSKQEALGFLRDLQSDLDARAEALEAELDEPE